MTFLAGITMESAVANTRYGMSAAVSPERMLLHEAFAQHWSMPYDDGHVISAFCSYDKVGAPALRGGKTPGCSDGLMPRRVV